jgi:hypothetical protein
MDTVVRLSRIWETSSGCRPCEGESERSSWTLPWVEALRIGNPTLVHYLTIPLSRQISCYCIEAVYESTKERHCTSLAQLAQRIGAV